ncbi:MAG: DsbA family oxidoreductase [Actinomycetota bacterium]
MSDTAEAATDQAKGPMKVEIWSDVVCPWCYIGKRRFETALERFTEATGTEVEIEYKAFMLDPRAPADPQPVSEVYAKKFGQQAEQILDKVTSEAAGEGLEFRMDIAQRANTLPAHRLLVLAQRHDLQIPLKERLMQAYFTEGTDVGDLETLVGLAVEVGLDGETARAWLLGEGGNEEVADSLEFAAANGLGSVPTYVFDRRIAVPGAQDPDTFVMIMERVASTDGPAQFED